MSEPDSQTDTQKLLDGSVVDKDTGERLQRKFIDRNPIYWFDKGPEHTYRYVVVKPTGELVAYCRTLENVAENLLP